jgi:hypothetical protein
VESARTAVFVTTNDSYGSRGVLIALWTAQRFGTAFRSALIVNLVGCFCDRGRDARGRNTVLVSDRPVCHHRIHWRMTTYSSFNYETTRGSRKVHWRRCRQRRRHHLGAFAAESSGCLRTPPIGR